MRADVGFRFELPGRHQIGVDPFVELAGDHSAYRFWLHEGGRFVPVAVVAGSPDHLDPEPLRGHALLMLFAAPAALDGQEELLAVWKSDLALLNVFPEPDRGRFDPRASRSKGQIAIQFEGKVMVYDSRDSVAERCRLVFRPGEDIDIVYLGQEPEPIAARIPRYVIGLALGLSVAWLGVMLIRRRRKKPPRRGGNGTIEAPPTR